MKQQLWHLCGLPGIGKVDLNLQVPRLVRSTSLRERTRGSVDPRTETCATMPARTGRDGRRCRSAETPKACKILDTIGGRHGAVYGFGCLSGNFAGPSDVLWMKDLG